jgi:thiamine transport system substrate-binding protein
MLRWALVVFFCLCVDVLANSAAKEEKSETLTVYTYDALTGKNSLGEKLKNEFEKNTGVKLNLISFGSIGEALNQIVIEDKKTKADILLGIDSSFAPRARSTNLFSVLPEKHFSELQPTISLGKDRLFLPFDYGYLAFIYNSQRVQFKGDSSSELTLSQFINSTDNRKRVVIEDPRTSSLGFTFLRWTQETTNSENTLKTLWKSFLPKLITIAPSWSGAYGLFLKGEADFVLSYSTSRAYHLEKEKKSEYEVLYFKDGHPLQVEAAAVVKHSNPNKWIEPFLSLLVGSEMQSIIPSKQWMYPARRGVSLPVTFKSLPVPKTILLSDDFSEFDRKALIKHWSEWVTTSP